MKKIYVSTFPLIVLLLFLIGVFGGAFYFLNSPNSSEPSLIPTDLNQLVSQEYEQNASEFLNSPSEPQFYSPISIDYLQSLNIDSPQVTIEQQLSNGSNYSRYIASYQSEGYKIYGLLTVPLGQKPENGFPAIVFNHGYIPPSQYVTTEKYVAYVDSLARNGFVVFKIDMRGHGNSEGQATGTYFSPSYTIDAISALKALQKYDQVDAERIGMWGHSMAGNLSLRAALVEQDVKAVVIWAGAVYSYADFAKYRLNDTSYVGRPSPTPRPTDQDDFETDRPSLRSMFNDDEVNFESEFWKSISLVANLEYLNAPVQLHHSVNDTVVNIGYARDLATELEAANKQNEIYEYQGGGHNINSPYFEQAMQRTVDFFKENL